jgi:hydrogenase nickel incorporation protein HypA/HybF
MDAEDEKNVHELSIATSICERVLEHAGGSRVEEMQVLVGALSGVNADSLEFVLPDAASICGLALDRFTVETVPAEATCQWGHTYEARELLEPCPRCGGFSRTYTGGEDVIINKLILVEENDDATG